MSDGVLPVLSRALVTGAEFQRRPDLAVPAPALLDLPEKAIQFGTGAFLRGFVDYFIDAANERGAFAGRVVMVSSTGSGRDAVVAQQDGLYTLLEQGVESGEARQEYRLVAAVSRALSAQSQWQDVLEIARSPALELVFSNTTEVGITLDESDSADAAPPRSFPGKLTAFLYERARHFDFDVRAGVVVLPCELIEQNGTVLRGIVLRLAELWQMDARFRAWIEKAVPFCNTLVDRIVPGTPTAAEHRKCEQRLGYRDGLLTTCELYRLFAIEAAPDVQRRLTFAAADTGVVLTDDVTPYRERKVKILNGAHTALAPVALLCGCTTVAEAMRHELIGRFVRTLVFDEIVPSTDVPTAEPFAHAVLDRFANPYLQHALFDITLQGTMKLRVRLIPTIVSYAAHTGRAPGALAFAFAAYLLFMRADLHARRVAEHAPVPADDAGAAVRARWSGVDATDAAAVAALVNDVCGQTRLWGVDLTNVPHFCSAVYQHLLIALREGMPAALHAHLTAPTAPAEVPER